MIRIKLRDLTLLVFVGVYFVFVVASAYYLKQNYAWLYFIKLGSSSSLAILGIFLFTFYMKKSYLGFFMVFFFVFLPYLFHGNSGMLLFGFYMAFLLVVIVLSKMWDGEPNLFVIAVLGVIALLPIALDYMLNGAGFIYNNYYGRGRLLLGFFHPKDAGISLLIPIILLYAWFTNCKYNKYLVILYHFAVIALLIQVSSRTALFFYLNMIFLSVLFRKGSFGRSLLIFFLVYALAISVVIIMFLPQINLLMSGRLANWSQVQFNLFGTDVLVSGFNASELFGKVHQDNFYIEYALELGLVAFSFLFLTLTYVIIKLKKTMVYSLYVNALFISFLVMCFSDAGMFSLGNIFNIFIWSYVVSAIYNSRKQIVGAIN